MKSGDVSVEWGSVGVSLLCRSLWVIDADRGTWSEGLLCERASPIVPTVMKSVQKASRGREINM
eukprot:7791925-Karenia_brevis.AAC.1